MTLGKVDTVLVVSYRQSTDPGAVGADIYWEDTSVAPNLLKRRTVANDGWDVVGGSGGGGGGGSGTVTSVGLSMPSEFAVGGTPVTGAGTLAVTKATQSANQVYAGPATGAAAAPGFRGVVPADLPALGASGPSHQAGAAPDPGSSAGTWRWLREDATWQPINVESGSSPVLASNGTITTASLTTTRVSPSAPVTGVILQAGTHAGQRVTVVNESIADYTIQFATAATSNVADGNSDVIPGRAARIYAWDSVTALWYVTSSGSIGTIDLIVDGHGTTITSGPKGDVRTDASLQIIGWYLYADQAGSVQFDIWSAPHTSFPPVVGNSIVGAGTKPAMVSSDHIAFSTLSNWTTAIPAGSVLRVNVDSASTVTRVTLALEVVRTS